jgi:uncharacterized protein
VREGRDPFGSPQTSSLREAVGEAEAQDECGHPQEPSHTGILILVETHTRLTGELITARKAQDKPLVLLLSTIVAEVKERVRVIENEEKRDVQDADVIDVIRKGIKKRRDSVEQYTAANRPELAQKEAEEIVLLERYLPAAVDPEVIRTAVAEVIASGVTVMGQVMGKVLPRFKGQAEGSVINAIVREELAKLV